MTDNANIWLSDAERTRSCGATLAQSLYDLPVTVELTGELGTGKTTFLQGFASALGITEPLTSPTFALEQRYESSRGAFIHLDLYRLSSAQAAELIAGTDDHDGIRCIEWADRLTERPEEGVIHIDLTEEGEGRKLTVTFNDIPLPSSEEIKRWREDVLLPENIIRHCDAVAAFTETLVQALSERGQIVRPLALRRAAEVHDLFRFIDFREGASHVAAAPTENQKETWALWKERYPGQAHEEACATFLREQGFQALAKIVEPHGLTSTKERETIEEELLYYADKRVKLDEVVSLEERWEDFRQRYGHGKETPDGKRWLQEAQKAEKQLFPEGPPG